LLTAEGEFYRDIKRSLSIELSGIALKNKTLIKIILLNIIKAVKFGYRFAKLYFGPISQTISGIFLKITLTILTLQ